MANSFSPKKVAVIENAAQQAFGLAEVNYVVV